jgi:hypothetical protein
MGLDMYLFGRKTPLSYKNNNREEDGFPVESIHLKMGYWRKHPNLHGFIVENMADGRDECQEITLSNEEITKIIEAIKEGNLPETEGFFFGASVDSEGQRLFDIQTFQTALDWINAGPVDEWRDAFYQASW